jgi:hypothetical protein
MKTLLVLLLLSPGTSFAQSPFDGTWIINADTALLPQKPTEYVLANGMFRCSGCLANLQIKADGHDYKIAESSYWDTASVRVADAHSVEIVAKKAGKTMYTETDSISPDGATLTQVEKDTTEAQTVTIETLNRRVTNGPAGSHSISGSWRAYKINRSKNGSTIKYRCTADGFSAETLIGERFAAKFDGKYYSVEDDPGGTTVSAKLLSSNSVELSFKRDGKVVGLLHLTVVPDGKSIHVVNENKESSTTVTYEMQKQP